MEKEHGMGRDATDSYPTVKELDFYPARSLEDEKRTLWSRKWEAINTNKNHLEKERLVFLGQSPLPTDYGDFTYLAFGDLTTGEHHEVLIFGNLDEGALGNGEDLLVRTHSACRTNEVYHSTNCECREEANTALQEISKEGRGIFIYLEQEGRGTGIAGKIQQLDAMFEWENGKIRQRRDEKGERIDTDRAYKQKGFPSEVRDFSITGEILARLGVKSVRLMTNNPDKIKGVEEYGIEVTPVSIHIPPENEIIASDLRSKAENLGHDISEEHWRI